MVTSSYLARNQFNYGRLQLHHKNLQSGQTLKIGLLISTLVTLLFVLLVTPYLFYGSLSPNPVHSPPKVTYKCHHKSASFNQLQILHLYQNVSSSPKLRSDSKVLLFVDSQYSLLAKQIIETLEAVRIKFKLEIGGRGLPILTNFDKGKYALVIFENFDKYLYMNKWNRDILEKYCRVYNVGIIGFMSRKDETQKSVPIKGYPLVKLNNLTISDYEVLRTSQILKMTKSGILNRGPLLGQNFTVFQSNHSNYAHITNAKIYNQYTQTSINISTTFESSISDKLVSTILYDQGLLDGIDKVLFSSGFDYWIHKLIFLDAITFLTKNKFLKSLQRYILVDIDDIFVGEQGTRLKPHDVDALIRSQNQLRSLIPGFKFNLGLSGKYYHRGNNEEDRGDDLLLANAHKFWWFCHMYSHSQPHLIDNQTILEAQMLLNKEFAVQNNIPISNGYSVAPHHSGVYPTHKLLYTAWKNVWNISVTSTEEYPHLRPARLRRGFIHQDIMVLPRQTCGLYTHTIFIDKYPGGRSKLDRNIFGGELFYLFIFNQFNIFMTHMSNYGNDRLAIYTFESVINFLKCWTNIQLKTITPVQLGYKYFQTYTNEANPIWMNPCKDKRHHSIWSPHKSCKRLPDFLIIGPQKSGTTALYRFLLMHSFIQSSSPSAKTFEEVQFFNGENYLKGIDWYMDFFPQPIENSSHVYLFEKSANYFDADLVPMRAHSLVPDAKIVTILISPVKRAYSWYQHARAHNDPISLNHSFYEVITATRSSPKPLRDLRNRCLNPGLYATHLEKWINYYSPRKLFIIDGDEFKENPASVINKLQRFLGVEPILNYEDNLIYNQKKGFFCEITSQNKTKCLGNSKGRIYPAMDYRSQKFLRNYYLPYNDALVRFLKKINQPPPLWLEEELTLA